MTITRSSDGRFFYVNDAFERMFGYSRAEVLGQIAAGLGLYADPAARLRLIELLNKGSARISKSQLERNLVA
jgi:two-component system, NtrC family, sensor kinase